MLIVGLVSSSLIVTVVDESLAVALVTSEISTVNVASEPLKRLLSLRVISRDLVVSPGAKLMTPDEEPNKDASLVLLSVA